MNSRQGQYLAINIAMLTFMLCVSRVFAMDALDQKIGQMIMVSYPPGTAFEDTPVSYTHLRAHET